MSSNMDWTICQKYYYQALTNIKSIFINFCHVLNSEGINIVIPKIGDSSESIMELTKQLKRFGYHVHLTLLGLDRKVATFRAVKRFHATSRYVPLSIVYDVYGNEPTISYYRIKNFHSDEFVSLGMLSNDVSLGSKPIVVESAVGNPAQLFL